MAWPQSTDFLEAVQDLAASMADEELQGGEVVRTPLGLPMLWAGNFADVFKVHCPATGNTWALKCFTRPVQGLHDRYRHIAAHLERASLPFTVDFQYLERGIRIAGEWFPVLKMRWVEGLTLSQFVEEHLEQPGNLKMLLDLWERLAARLREAQVTHADLQHGNVLLVPTSGGAFVLRLVDYDGMFVPALEATRSGEVGHPAYQHPQRLREGIFNAEVDRFSHLAIYTAIRCLMSGRTQLWERFNNGDNLLFREDDFRKPGESKLFRLLWQNLRDSNTRSLVGRLILACKSPLEKTPLLDEILSNGKSVPLDRKQEAAVNAVLASAADGPVESWAVKVVPSDVPMASSAIAGVDQPPPLPGSHKSKGAWGHFSFKTALTPLRVVDRVLRAIAGPENPLLHNFLRVVAVVAAFALPIGASFFHSHQQSLRERAAALLQQQDAERREAIAKATKEEESRKQVEEESRQRKAEEDRNAAEAEAARKAAEDAKERLAKAEAARKMAEEELLGKTIFGERIRVFNGPPMTSVAFLPNGRQIVAGTMNGSTILWDALTGKEIRVFEDHKQPVPTITVNPQGNQFLTGSLDHTVILSDIATGRQIRVFEGNECSAFSPDGKYILTGSWTSHRATLWNAATGEQVRVLPHEPNDVITTVAFSPDGKWILTGCGQGGGKVSLWDTETGASIRSTPGHNGTAFVAFREDAKRVLIGARDVAKIWDTTLNKQISAVRYGGNSAASCVAFSRDGKRVLTGFPDSSTILWDVENGKSIHTFKGHSKYVHAVAFSPDGKRVLTGSIDGTAILWNANGVGLHYHRDGLREGILSIEDKNYAIAILDDKTTGDYSKLANIEIVTPDGQERPSSSSERKRDTASRSSAAKSNRNTRFQRASANSAFKLGDKDYVISSIADDGSRLAVRDAKWGELTGEVLDQKTGKKIDAATVSVQESRQYTEWKNTDAKGKTWQTVYTSPKFTAETDADGRFRIPVPEGNYSQITVTAKGYVPNHDERKYTVAANANIMVTEQLTPAVALTNGRVTLRNSDSYHFLTQTMSQHTGGDFYFLASDRDRAHVAKFWANNKYQGGLVDLGNLNDKPLEQVVPPAAGYNHQGVSAIRGHTYVSPAKEGEEGHHIVFRVIDFEADGSVDIEYLYR